MTDQELHLLIHPDEWPYKELPVARRGGDPINNQKDAGVVARFNLCRVWSEIYLGDSLTLARPIDYLSPEALLSEWKIN